MSHYLTAGPLTVAELMEVSALLAPVSGRIRFEVGTTPEPGEMVVSGVSYPRTWPELYDVDPDLIDQPDCACAEATTVELPAAPTRRLPSLGKPGRPTIIGAIAAALRPHPVGHVFCLPELIAAVGEEHICSIPPALSQMKLAGYLAKEGARSPYYTIIKAMPDAPEAA